MSAKTKLSFDPICAEIADHFLPTGAGTDERQSLAQVIQDAIEAWLNVEAMGNPASAIARAEGCTCMWIGQGSDPDAHVKMDEWCPLHGRDPDAEREVQMEAPCPTK